MSVRETYNLMVQPRDGAVRAKTLRKQGVFPLVLYGRKVESVALSADQMIFEKLLREAGQSSIVIVTIEGDKEEHPILIQDIQYDAVTDRPIHADLYQVRMDELIEAEVPIVFVGEAPAVKEQDGILLESLRTVRVKALPLELPHEIEVSLDVLKNIDDAISVDSLSLSDGVEILEDASATIISVSPPRSEEELEELDEEVDEVSDLESIEGADDDPKEGAEEGGEAGDGDTESSSPDEEENE